MSTDLKTRNENLKKVQDAFLSKKESFNDMVNCSFDDVMNLIPFILQGNQCPTENYVITEDGWKIWPGGYNYPTHGIGDHPLILFPDACTLIRNKDPHNLYRETYAVDRETIQHVDRFFDTPIEDIMCFYNGKNSAELYIDFEKEIVGTLCTCNFQCYGCYQSNMLYVDLSFTRPYFHIFYKGPDSPGEISRMILIDNIPSLECADDNIYRHYFNL